ncbi:MAG TPA: LON peptidase substrate-binding domain-containing protein, partial [Pirellulales bacterium]
MSASDDLFVPPEQFSGTARLFPLPNLVLFPHVLQPLHIFEPRYREMLEEAMADDRLLAMSLLMPGWEADYEGRPPVLPMACLGRVASCQQLADGRYNVLLAGLKRAAITKELPADKSFREARVRLKEDRYPIQGAATRPGLQRHLLEIFAQKLPRSADMREQFDQLLAAQISLGTLTDILAYSIELTVGTKQRLLSELDVDRRAAMLVEHLEHADRQPTAAQASAV